MAIDRTMPGEGGQSESKGLTSAEAAARLEQYGPNDPAPRKRYSAIAEFLAQFLNPLVLILLIAAIASLVLGEVVDAAIILVIVALSNILNFLQVNRSHKAVEQLQRGVAPTATVWRDERWQTVQRIDVVPGDVIQLSAGDLVPSDARLLESRDLYVQQAALTGESLPVEKQADDQDASTRPGAANMVFLGTSVVSGTATALVVATGPRTSFGDIAARLAARAEPTSFDRGLKDFSIFLTRTVLFLVIFLVVVGALKHRDAFQSLLFAIALAVGLTPEFLPMIVSVTLSNGARAMARKKVIVKHLSAIENFGSIDVLCSDKTGTLTSGEMALDQSIDAAGAPSDRVLVLARLNAKFETGIRSPFDSAILSRETIADEAGCEKVDEIPYDFERRRSSIVVKKQSQRTLITKGAPEAILGLSVCYESNGRAAPLDAVARKHCQDVFANASTQGRRVLAVAYSLVEVQSNYSASDECNLTLAGFLTFTDPPLPDAAQTLAALRQDGVEVKIITGDSDIVTQHVCGLVGLDVGTIVRGDDIDAMTDTALAQVAVRTTVFARISPTQKNRILLALKHSGHVVGFLGDGINDAPSLHAADVGISVSTAVDVAREAADIILVERGLEVLADGIHEGRRAFGNVMKYLFMGTSSNFGNMLSMAGVSAFLPFLPMLPTQILLNNFLYDMSQLTIPTDNVDPDMIRKPRQWDISVIRRFMVTIGPISSIFDFLTFYVLLSVFHAGQTLFHTAWFVESLATQTLVIVVIRTTQRPWRSRPSRALAATTLLVVAIGVLLPFSPLAGLLGFAPPPPAFFVYLVFATATYLVLVEIGKRFVLRRSADMPPRGAA